MIHWALGTAYIHKGMYDEGLAKLLKTSPPEDYAANADLAYGCAVSGNHTKAREILENLLKGSEGNPRDFDISRIYGGLGDKTQAFGWMRKAV